MIKLVIKDVKEFHKSIDAIGVLISEGLFVVDSEKLYLRATDPSQISLIDFLMPKDAFQEFVVDLDKDNIEKNISFGVNINNLLQILSHSSNNDRLSIEISKGKPNLLIELIGDSKRAFTIPLIDLSNQKNPLPNIQHDVTIDIDKDRLNRGIKDASLFSAHLTFRVEDSKLFLETKSSKGKFKQEIEGGTEKIKISGTKAKAMFPLDYLQNMIKNSKENITLKLKDDMPLEMSYSVGSAAIRYFLAPRVDTE